MRTSSYSRTARPNQANTEKSMMSVIRGAVSNQVKQRDMNLTKQIKDLEKAQRVLDNDIKQVKKQAYHVAVREYDIKELEKDVKGFKELMHNSSKVQLETTNVLKHIKEMKRQTHQFNQLPTTPHVSMEFSQSVKSAKLTMSSGTLSDDDFEYDTSDLDEEVPAKIALDFTIPPHHEQSEQIKRVRAFVEKLEQEVTQHEKIVVSYENLAREKRVRNAIQMKIRLSLDKRSINAEFKRNSLESQYNAEISHYKSLLSQKNQLVKRLNAAMEKKSQLDVDEYDIVLREEYTKNLGSEKYHLKKSEDRTFESSKFVKSDNHEYINNLETKITQELENLIKEQNILEEQLKEASMKFENTKSSINANLEHTNSIINKISNTVNESAVDFEKVSSDIINQTNSLVSLMNKRSSITSTELENNNKAIYDLQSKLEDINKERLELTEKECGWKLESNEEVLRADTIRSNVTDLKDRKEYLETQLNIYKIREKVASEILDLLIDEYED